MCCGLSRLVASQAERLRWPGIIGETGDMFTHKMDELQKLLDAGHGRSLGLMRHSVRVRVCLMRLYQGG